MPGHCCVPFCKANYPTGPRVSVFSFPRDDEIVKKWIEAIPKKDFSPSPSTKVCQRHFKPEDILTETSGYDSKRKVTITVPLKNYRLKAEAVPCIFEENPVKQPKKVKKSPLKDNQEKDNIESSTRTSMQKKGTKSQISSMSGVGTPDRSNKHDDQRRGAAKSPKKVSPTTDRPIIAVIKAEDLIMEHEKSPEKSHEDTDSIDVEPVTPGSKSFSLPSPFKNLPNVSVCLKEEDRVPLTREFKGVKRSPSTGSSSSTGSTDAQKSASLTKRRKVEKPAPIVIGCQNDCYCWVCHRENVSLSCIACPRAYHFKCAGESSSVSQASSDWVCPECQRILAAENVDTRSSTLAEISLDKLGALLRLSLNKMKQRAPIAFHQPVSLEHYPLYLHYVIHPMDFTLLEKNIKQKVYGCTEAFLADVKWMSHNSCVFNGTQHPLSSNAKNIVKACDQDMQEIEVCPDCFVHSVVRNKYWFSEVCRKPHPLVWAKLKGFPYWPAKVVRILDGNVDARFFGAHDRAWVPVSQCYHLSKEMPTTSKPKKKGNYEVALDELNVHVHLLIQKFGTFEYAPYRTSFTPENNYLMYHGIDVDNISKEEITIDNSIPQQDPKVLESQKENRFASFIESEYGKSNKDETKASESQSEIQFNNSSNDDGVKFPPFFFKQRKSTDSVISEKEVSVAESESKSIVESAETKESNASEDSSVKKPDKLSSSEKISDSDQLRKLELALERIKGYVSLNVDSEKENEIESEENQDKKEECNKNMPEEGKKDEIEKSSITKSLFKEAITLPVIEPSSVDDEVKDVSVALEATKKTDSFFLKLNETIKSCKAKLGISEIDDELSSDESGADENDVSRSDEDDTSGSEAEEASDEDGEEEEVMEVSDEEMENEEDENKLEDDESVDEEESEEDEGSQSSDTDIESTNETATRTEMPNLENVDDKNDPKEVASDIIMPKKDSVKELTNDSNEAIITNPDMQVPEVTIDGSSALEIIGENSSSENSEDIKEHSESSLNRQVDGVGSSKTAISPSKISIDSEAESNSSSEDSKNENSTINTVEVNEKQMSPVSFSLNKNHSPSKNVENASSPIKNCVGSRISSEGSCAVKPDTDEKQNDHVKTVEKKSSKNEADEDDDEIYICTPTKPKSPPIIVLDDDHENENSSISDTFAIKTPPYSTSVDSFSNEENPSCKSLSDDEYDDTHEKPLTINGKVASEKLHTQKMNSEEKIVNSENGTLDSKSSAEKRKRKFAGSSSEDDDIQIVTPAKKKVLTGAIRTFNKPNNDKPPTLKPSTPTMETVKRNLEKESLNQINRSPTSTESSQMEVHSPQDQFLSDPLLSPQTADNLLRSPVIDASNLSDKDKEILFLKRKLNCVVTAYQIQSWKCNQERDELRHNMNLIVMEMRACLESDKKQAIEALSQKLAQEKDKCIEEAKRKQWCANCLTESRYSCCWNTSYCSVDCQKQHFPEHRSSCSQLKNKTIEVVDMKKKSEKKENKKVIILTTNMKTPEGTKQVSVSKSQILVPPPNNVPLQIATSSSNSNIQFVLAPVKPSAESVVATSSAPTIASAGLDSSKIISQVRNKSVDLGTAISLLKKKNIESSKLSILSKKEEKPKKEEQPKKEEKPKKEEQPKKEQQPINEEPKKEEKAKEDTNLEDIYFPSPPSVTFEGYETASPDPNIVLLNEDLKDDGDSEAQDSELPIDYAPEQDVSFSDTDEKDNEMFNIGHGVEVKAKFLNKCLVYGKTAKKLTRCLVDIIFPDVKLLATCSAFGQKSNVTKLTRAALPTRKVHAIIDFVKKRFPEASRSEVVLSINMKCKEARVIVNRKETDIPKKTMIRRMLAREKEGEVVTVSTPTTSTAAPSPVVTPPIVNSPVITSSNNKTFPNLVCVKSKPQSVLPFSMPNKSMFDLSAKSASGSNILRCNTQIVIRPKALVNTSGSAAIIQSPLPRKRETVKNLLAANKVKLPMGNLSKDGTQLVMSLDNLKPSSSVSQPVSLPTSTINNNMRPYIIIGSQMNAVKTSSSVQHPILTPAPAPSHINK